MTNSYTNPDLDVAPSNMPRWNTPEKRRHGFRNLHRINRYGMSLRSDQVLGLEKNINFRIDHRPDVQQMTSCRPFCGMAVARGQELLFEKYADDFSPNQPHTIMSISKTTINLIVGELVAQKKLDLNSKVKNYLPEIGSGYAEASLQKVMDMDLVNNYSEDYSDFDSMSYAHEIEHGWRLQGDDLTLGQRDFLPTIQSDNIDNPAAVPQYKSANTDVMAWVIERAGDRPLREWMIKIVEAAGFEESMHISTDRTGMPVLDGGICLTLRDLTRYGLLLSRLGKGVAQRQVGNAGFIQHSRSRASLEYPQPRRGMFYSNHFYTNKRWIGHGGWGGQFLLVNLETGIVCSFFSVLENTAAHDIDYSVTMVRMLEEISEQF